MARPMKLFTSFSGIGFQERGIQMAGYDVDVVGTSETDVAAIWSYAAIHNGLTEEMVENYDEYPSREEMVQWLVEHNIGYDFDHGKAYNWEKKIHSKGNDIEKTWLACKLNHNFGDICKIDKIPKCDLFTYSSPCFVADTVVQTSAGFKKIIDITTDDKITYLGKEYKITNTFDNGVHDVIDMTFEDGYVVTCTLNHKFLVNRDGYYEWVEAYKLTYFDNIATNTGDNISVINKDNFRQEHVYDIEVETVHLFPLENGIIVHNCQSYSIAGRQDGNKITCHDCGFEFNPFDYEVNERYECPNCHSVNITSTRSGLMAEVERLLLNSITAGEAPTYLLQENVDALVSKSLCRISRTGLIVWTDLVITLIGSVLIRNIVVILVVLPHRIEIDYSAFLFLKKKIRVISSFQRSLIVELG